MKKILQNMMYGVSLVLVVAIIVALVMSGRSTAQTQSAEVQETVTEKGRESNGEMTTENVIDIEVKETEQEENVQPAEHALNQTTTIIFTGDVLFGNAFKAGYDAKGIAGVISEELLTELKNADILMVNQEFPFGETGEPMADKQYTFQCSPSYVTALQEMGVDVVSLANNHILDYGKESLHETFATLDEAGILYAGAGETVERAKEVQVIERNGKKYGFIAVSRVVPTGSWKVENSAPGVFSCYDDLGLLEVIKQASTECDFLAVYPHWGVEYASHPEDYQTAIAERCLEAGADIVVGSHTHCLQGVTFLEDKPVCYSLGNFVFGQNIDQSAILKVTIASDGTVNYQYLPVYAAGGVTYLAEGERATEILSYLDGISDATVGMDGMITQ